MESAEDVRDVDIGTDVNIHSTENPHPKQEDEQPHPYFAWIEQARAERAHRRRRDDKSSFIACLMMCALTCLLLAPPAWVLHRKAATWSGSSQSVSISTVSIASLPVLHDPDSGANRAVREAARPRPEGDRAALVHSPTGAQEAGESREDNERDAMSQDGPNKMPALRVLTLAAQMPTKVHPRPAQSDTTAPLVITAQRLIPAPELTEAQNLDAPPLLDVGSFHVDYPEDARKREIEGRVVLHLYVDASGHPSSIHVLSSLHPSCDRAAVAALYAARFTPGQDHGRPVGTFTRLVVRFVLR